MTDPGGRANEYDEILTKNTSAGKSRRNEPADRELGLENYRNETYLLGWWSFDLEFILSSVRVEGVLNTPTKLWLH